MDLKRCVWILLVSLLLCGCAAEETFETIADEPAAELREEPKPIRLSLPGETALPVMERGGSRLYLWEDHELLVQTLEGGDLEATLLMLTGCSRDGLTVLETRTDGLDRYEFVWAAAGESGDRVGRGVILDDGSYHYCLSALWDAEAAETGQTNWDQVFSSFSVAPY